MTNPEEIVLWEEIRGLGKLLAEARAAAREIFLALDDWEYLGGAACSEKRREFHARFPWLAEIE